MLQQLEWLRDDYQRMRDSTESVGTMGARFFIGMAARRTG
ncbi:hypothetical protein DF3PB_1010013 [uncultured Defluviicoccus sp.]|uniref:Uncharacterized protein n=1 Tax=metagenome TaxID=256318 RepID=A0A380T7R9_9ZZZZ|nr:hypothetical protein DF3PB_1010013 [uncultured Defluviicoccus sp.]